jgi:hypothetical protein
LGIIYGNLHIYIIYTITHRIHVWYANIYHQYTPNVSLYTIHGSYGLYTSHIRYSIPTLKPNEHPATATTIWASTAAQ